VNLSTCSLSIPLMLGLVVGVVVHPVAGIVLGLAVLGWNVVQAIRGKSGTTCAIPRS